jgi:hypothetical protein
MKASIEQYLDAAVAARRTERQINQQEAAWDRWVARAPTAAHRRAFMHGEAAVWLRTVFAEQDALIRQLADQIRAERRRF